MSRPMGKPTICICENKGADQLRGYTAKLISAFVFATRIVQFLYFLNPKFQASSSFLCLYRSVCVRPVQKPHCLFSHEAAHMIPFSLSFVCSKISSLLQRNTYKTLKTYYHTCNHLIKMKITTNFCSPRRFLLKITTNFCSPRRFLLRQYFKIVQLPQLSRCM